MLAWFASILAGIILVLVSQSSAVYKELAGYTRSQVERGNMIEVASGLESYYQERGVYPATLQALASTPGYEHLHSGFSNNMGYTKSGALNDGTWQFQRAVVYLVPAGSDDRVDTYPAKNYCGTGSSLTAISWCGNRQGLYYRRETRDTVNEDLTTQQVRLIRLQMKFARFYNAFAKYPDKNSSNGALSEGSLSTVAELAGYTGAPSSCQGTHQYLGIPIDCSDMFDRWGNYVTYQFESATHVIFISESPFFNASGERVIVAVDRM